MRRAEIHVAQLDPSIGSEARKLRPVVIVSNDGANAAAVAHGRGVITVVPLTSNLRRVLSFQVVVPASASGLRQDAKAQVEQVRTVDVSRFGAPVGRVPPAVMKQIDAALRRHLLL